MTGFTGLSLWSSQSFDMIISPTLSLGSWDHLILLRDGARWSDYLGHEAWGMSRWRQRGKGDQAWLPHGGLCCVLLPPDDPPFLHVIPCNYNASNWCVHSTSSNTNCRFEFLRRALMYEAGPISLWFSWNGDIGALTITISYYRCLGGVDEGSNHLCKDVRCWVFVDIIVVSPAPIVSTLSHILSVTFSLRPH